MRQKEIEEIYNKQRLTEEPPSKNFYVDKDYTYDPYPIFEPVKGCQSIRKGSGDLNLPKLMHVNFKKWQGAKMEWNNMKQRGHLTNEEYCKLLGEYDSTFCSWHQCIFENRSELEKAILKLSFHYLEKNENK